MPCDSSYMEPTKEEKESLRVSKLILFICKQLNLTPDSSVKAAAKKMYGAIESLDAHTAMLCRLCREMTYDQQTRIIYNGRDAQSRKLADWWDSHKAQDARRARDDAKKAEYDKVVAGLSAYQREVLGIKSDS